MLTVPPRGTVTAVLLTRKALWLQAKEETGSSGSQAGGVGSPNTRVKREK